MERQQCSYCGKEGRLTREHIVPKVLGGTVTRRIACARCNNSVLGPLDKELAWNSPLAFAAMVALHKKTRFTWDVNHHANNLLLEAYADHNVQNMTLWPQLVLDDEELGIYVDAEEQADIGNENLHHIFVARLRAAFHEFRNGRRARINFEPVNGRIPPIYRLPPRIFATRRLREFDDSMTFQCRYLHNEDRRRLLHRLETWDANSRFRNSGIFPGSPLPLMKAHFRADLVLRSLVKIALNLIEYGSDNSNVNRQTFPRAVRTVTGELAVAPELLSKIGFVNPDQLQDLACPDNAHKFRLIFNKQTGYWSVFCSFYGNEAGAAMTLPGTHGESWNMKEITVPLFSRDWSSESFILVRPISPRVTWDIDGLISSMEFVNPHSAYEPCPAVDRSREV